MSSAIARLERELGVPLFDRSVTPIVLTEHGAVLQAGAQRILEAVQAARDDVAAVSGQVRGTVTLACTLNTGTLDLAEMLERVRDRHPGVIVKLRQSSSGSAGNLRSVRDGSVDIALCASGGNGHVSDLSRAVLSRASYQSPHTLLPDCAGTYRTDTSYRPSLNRRSGVGRTSQEASRRPRRPRASADPAAPEAPGLSGLGSITIPENTTKPPVTHEGIQRNCFGQRKYRLMNNHGAHEVKMSNGCFRTTQSIALMGPSMAPWTSATWNISWHVARPAASPPPPARRTSSSRPCRAPSPGWSGSSGHRYSTGTSHRSP